MSEELTLHLPDRDLKIRAEAGETLFSALSAVSAFPLDAPCGGLGKCGKCLVTVREPGGEKRQVPACRTPVRRGMELWPEDTALFAQGAGDFALPAPDPAPEGSLGLAFDLGTTTIAASLWALDTGRRLAGIGEKNEQRRFGADVLSRISFGVERGEALLRDCLRGQLCRMAETLCRKAGRDMERVLGAAAAGNTVMEHFLAGLSAQGLGAAPFRPESLFGCEAAVGLPAPAYLAPCPAGYVGGDITAGLLALGADRLPGRFMLIDVGTNGEMVLGDSGAMVCCATAAGPAFEGAEIRCGMSGAPGAIHQVELDEAGGLRLSVLGGGPAVGICGSGLVDALSAMLELGAVSESGRLLPQDLAPAAARPHLGREGDETVFYLTPDKGVYLTGGDVRRLQLAKAAICAGAETLLAGGGLPDQVFLAGGFGAHLRVEKALHIGLLPPALRGRIRAVGNTALSGAEHMLLSGAARARAQEIRGRMTYRELSGDRAFSEAYLEAMAFEEG